MQRKTPVAGIVMTVLGGLFALIAVLGLLGNLAMGASTPVEQDTAYVLGRIIGILLWPAAAAVLLTFGIRSILRVKRHNDELARRGPYGY